MTRTVDLRERLAHVRWVGGGSGAGKSTVVRRLADRHGLRVYASDEVMSDHAARCSPHDCPQLSAFLRMTVDERWLHRSPSVMFETFHWFQGEAFDLVVEDLLRSPAGAPVIAEGFRLLPHLVRPLLSRPAQAVWLLPTPRFRRAAFERRGGCEWEVVSGTSDPQQALSNLLERDRMFTERLAGEVSGLGLDALDVDTTMSEDDLAERVAAALALDVER